MKIFLLGSIFIICTFVGYLFSLKYKKRQRFFSSLIMLAEKLDVEINYSRERLKKLVQEFDPSQKKHLLGIDSNFTQYLEGDGELVADSLFKNVNVLSPCK